MKGNWLKRMGTTALAGGTGLVMLASTAVFPVSAASDSTTTSVLVLGDVDRDNAISAADAILLLQYDAGLISDNTLDMALADLDGNGEVDVTDAVLALQTAAGLVQKKFCETLDISGAVQLQGIKRPYSQGVISSFPELESLKQDYPGDPSVLAAFDREFFDYHSLVAVGSQYHPTIPSMTLKELLWDGTQYRVTANYTQIADFNTVANITSVLLIPVEKRPGAAPDVQVIRQMQLANSGDGYASSFMWVSSDETADFKPVESQLSTVHSRQELNDIVNPICRTDERSEGYDQFIAIHDEAYFADNALLVLTCNYTDNYRFSGFRDNADGSRTLLISHVSSESQTLSMQAIAPRPCIFTVDVPLSFLEGHPVTGYEIVA